MAWKPSVNGRMKLEYTQGPDMKAGGAARGFGKEVASQIPQCYDAHQLVWGTNGYFSANGHLGSFMFSCIALLWIILYMISYEFVHVFLLDEIAMSWTMHMFSLGDTSCFFPRIHSHSSPPGLRAGPSSESSRVSGFCEGKELLTEV